MKHNFFQIWSKKSGGREPRTSDRDSARVHHKLGGCGVDQAGRTEATSIRGHRQAQRHPRRRPRQRTNLVTFATTSSWSWCSAEGCRAKCRDLEKLWKVNLKRLQWTYNVRQSIVVWLTSCFTSSCCYFWCKQSCWIQTSNMSSAFDSYLSV